VDKEKVTAPSKFSRVPELLDREIKRLETGMVLDLGAGLGVVGQRVREECPRCNVMACDADRARAEVLTDKFGLDSGFCDVKKPSYPDEVSDLTVLKNVVMDVPSDQLPEVVSEVRRVTKPQKRIFFSAYRLKGATNPDFSDPERFKSACKDVASGLGKVIESRTGKDSCQFVIEKQGSSEGEKAEEEAEDEEK